MIASRTDSIGQGVLTLSTGSGSFDVTIDAANDNLDGLARAINAADAGVTATVIADAGGFRLLIKGKTGEDQAFTTSVAPGTTRKNAVSDSLVTVRSLSMPPLAFSICV